MNAVYFTMNGPEALKDGRLLKWRDGRWVDANPLPFRVGDIVTRGDGDRHVVEAINDAGDLLDLRCIVGCAWCQPGDLEANMASRYEHAGEIVEGSR